MKVRALGKKKLFLFFCKNTRKNLKPVNTREKETNDVMQGVQMSHGLNWFRVARSAFSQGTPQHNKIKKRNFSKSISHILILQTR